MPTLTTNGIETHYDQHGSGLPLVMVHASTLDSNSWKPQVAALRDRFRVITYDLRGHGNTAKAKGQAYSVDTLAEDLRALIDGLRLERPVLCGLSMGGMVVQTYAARHPDAARALILAGAPTPRILRFSERVQRAWLPRFVALVARLTGYEPLRKRMAAMQRKVHGKDAVGSFESTDLPRMSTRDFIHAIRCFATFHRTRIDLRRIRVPVLVLFGDKEPAFLLRHEDRFRQLIPQAVLKRLARAGHASNTDEPDAFNEALRGFLRQTSGAAPRRAQSPQRSPTA